MAFALRGLAHLAAAEIERKLRVPAQLILRVGDAEVDEGDTPGVASVVKLVFPYGLSRPLAPLHTLRRVQNLFAFVGAESGIADGSERGLRQIEAASARSSRWGVSGGGTRPVARMPRASVARTRAPRVPRGKDTRTHMCARAIPATRMRAHAQLCRDASTPW